MLRGEGYWVKSDEKFNLCKEKCETAVQSTLRKQDFTSSYDEEYIDRLAISIKEKKRECEEDCPESSYECVPNL